MDDIHIRYLTHIFKSEDEVSMMALKVLGNTDLTEQRYELFTESDSA